MTDNKIQARFDKLADERQYWQDKNRYYYDAHKSYFKFLIPPKLKVLEVGCGLGDLLAAVKPAYGVGIDISQHMVDAAKERHPDLHFYCHDAENLSLNETFDIIILSDVIGHLSDVQQLLLALKEHTHADTRLCINYYNSLWEPVLTIAEKLHLKMPQRTQNWLASGDINNLLYLSGFDVIKQERRLLLPKEIPILSALFNRFIATVPLLNKLCLNIYMVARLAPTEKRTTEYSVTIVIPCRNEKGNIRNAITRIPAFGTAQEIIFIDGHSTDGTPEEIEAVIAENPDKNIRFMVQDGTGKGDAVRKAFAAAQNEMLMILDADLTMPPEDLPKFYNAIAQHQGEFINGCRLIYPMEDQAMRFLNMLGNKFFAMMFSWLLNQRIRDTLCGTKVLLKSDYDRIAANRDYFGDFDPFGDFDLLFGASKANLKIIEMPIRYRERVYGETNISRFKHGWLLLKMTVFAFFKLKAIE
jgi:SAM-dependent methyltransferase